MTVQTSGGLRWATVAATGLLLTLVMAIGAVNARAAGTVAKFVIAPVPIGTAATQAPGGNISVTVTAEDSTGAAVSGATIWLVLNQAAGGGTAVVGSTPLKMKPTMVTADSNGQVVVTYAKPASYPNDGEVDIINALNAATAKTSTAKGADSFCFNSVATITSSPKPIAGKGKLGPSQTVPVTFQTKLSNGVADSGTAVWIAFHQATGGGTASVNGHLIGKTPTLVVTDPKGQVAVSYTTPVTPPLSGTDRISLTDTPRVSCVMNSSSYTF